MFNSIYDLRVKPIFLICMIILSFLILKGYAHSATYYLAPPAGGPGGTGTIDDPWHDLNYALNLSSNPKAIKAGDTLYLRGGTYYTSNMTIPSGVYGPRINITTTVNSPRTTIKSYPGEWAILDGRNTSDINNPVPQSIILSATTKIYNLTIEDLEVQYGLGTGFRFGDGTSDVRISNGIFRNIYFHDNTQATSAENPGGMQLASEHTIIEYCTFKNNGSRSDNGSDVNSAQLVMFLDYGNFGNIDQWPRKNNTIRYNVFDGNGKSIGIKDKGDNNFISYDGTSHPEYASEIYNNIFINNGYADYYVQSDYVKIHNNLFIGGANSIGIFYQAYPNGKALFGNKVFNNTFYNKGRSAIWYKPNDQSYYINGAFKYAKSQDHDFYNNLFITTNSFVPMTIADGSAAPSFTNDHDGFNSTFTDNIASYLLTPRSLSSWKTLGKGTGAIQVPLKLVDPANNDYTLPADSPAKGSGRNGEDLGAFPIGKNWYSQAGAKFAIKISPPANLQGSPIIK